MIEIPFECSDIQWIYWTYNRRDKLLCISLHLFMCTMYVYILDLVKITKCMDHLSFIKKTIEWMSHHHLFRLFRYADFPKFRIFSINRALAVYFLHYFLLKKSKFPKWKHKIELELMKSKYQIILSRSNMSLYMVLWNHLEIRKGMRFIASI